MADSLIEKLEACAEAHRMWSRKVPGSGQITMVANLLDEAAKRIAELEAQNKKLTSRGFVGAQEQIIARLRARLDAVKTENAELTCEWMKALRKLKALERERNIAEGRLEVVLESRAELEVQLTAQRRDREAMKTAWNEEMNELRARLEQALEQKDAND